MELKYTQIIFEYIFLSLPEIPILDNKTYIYIYSHTLKGKIKAKRTTVAHIYTYRKKGTTCMFNTRNKTARTPTTKIIGFYFVY